MRQELGVNRHHIFEMPVNWTVLNHPNLAIALNDLSFNLSNLLIQENGNVLFTAENILSSLNDAVRTKRIGDSRPPQGRFSLLP